MAYRDLDALLARIANLESERAGVRARANRIARRRRAARISRLAAIVVPLFIVGVVLFIGVRGACGCVSGNDQAQVDVRTLQAVAEHWRVDHGPVGCPTLERLVRDRELSAASKLEDPWGRRYEIRCDGESDATVASSGPDGRFGTSDDTVFPGMTMRVISVDSPHK